MITIPLAAGVLQGQPGSLDTTLMSTGRLNHALGGSVQTSGWAVQTDGKILAVGQRDSEAFVVRFNEDGTLDPGFNGGVLTYMNGTYARAVDVTEQPDGKVVVVGHWYLQLSNIYWPFMLRFQANGLPDPFFGVNGAVEGLGLQNTAFTSVEVLPDGRIMTGASDLFDGMTVLRFLPNGQLDPTYGSGGLSVPGLPTAESPVEIVPLPDGRCLAASARHISLVDRDPLLVRLLPDGSIDPSFGNMGVTDLPLGAGSEVFTAITVDAGGRAVAVGYDVFGGNDGATVVCRFDTLGSLDTTFSGTGMLTIDIEPGFDSGGGIGVQADGSLMLGATALVGGTRHLVLACLRPDGMLETWFGNNGLVQENVNGVEPAMNTVVVLPDSRVFCGSATSNVPGQLCAARFTYGLSVDVGKEVGMAVQEWRIGPVPANEMIHLTGAVRNDGPYTFSVFDGTGGLAMSGIIRGDPTSGTHRIDISGLAVGTYVLRVEGISSVWSTRFLKE